MSEANISPEGRSPSQPPLVTPTDTDILDWLEDNRRIDIVRHWPGDRRKAPYWRRTFGPKDETNEFKTLREAVTAQMRKPT